MKEKRVKQIRGFSGKYWISDDGFVLIQLQTQNNRQGYPTARLQTRKGTRHKRGADKRVFVHRLVAKAFVPNPRKLPQVNHKNNVKPDNRWENLEWCTSSHNCLHREKYRKVMPWVTRRARYGKSGRRARR